jgi:Na+/proline symporter
VVTTGTALALTVVTLVAFAALGIRVSRGRVDSVDDLLTARNSVGGGRMTATLVASVMGVWILFAAPEAGARFGIAAVAGYAVGEAIPMLAYAKIGPRVREVIPDGHSLTEYAHVRYGSAMYALVIVVSVFYMFIFLAAELTGIAAALSLVAEVPQWQTALLVGGFVLLYTGYGGLRASIVTDTVQALVVLPLLVIALAGAVLALGGAREIHAGALATDPTLLDPTALAGVQFGVALAFAITGAELLNQTWWQRVYAGADGPTVERGFQRAALTNGLIVFLAALFGVVAVGATTVEAPAVAFFTLLLGAFPEWVVLAVVLLALLLVMSSVDSLFSALASVVTVDLSRFLAVPDDRTLTLGARVLTVVVAIAAIAVSLEATSVLELFFFADLLGAALALPLVLGLFSTRLTGRGALFSSLGGLAVGVAYFPFPFGIGDALRSLPGLGPLLPAADGLYLLPFAGAFLASGALALASARLVPGEFDHARLATEIRRLEDAATDGSEPVSDSDESVAVETPDGEVRDP